MILVPVDKNVLHKVQLDDSLLIALLHNENEPGEEVAIFDQRGDWVVLTGQRAQPQPIQVLLSIFFLLQHLIGVDKLW